VVIDEGFLDGAVEALDVGVHPGVLGMGVPALNAGLLEGYGKDPWAFSVWGVASKAGRGLVYRPGWRMAHFVRGAGN
jgi:hypothetical protein